MLDNELIATTIARIAATADHYPGVVIVINLQADRVEYMSARGLQLLDTSQQELTALGADYHVRFFNPDEAQEYVPKIYALLKQDDPTATVSFFQQVRTGPNRMSELYLSTAKVLAVDTAGQPLLLINLSFPIDPTSHFTVKVQRLFDENQFLRAHAASFACLTKREREALCGVVLGQSAAESAEALFISPQTVETHRRNLRRKLGTSSIFELGQYARAFDLI